MDINTEDNSKMASSMEEEFNNGQMVKFKKVSSKMEFLMEVEALNSQMVKLTMESSKMVYRTEEG